MFDKSVHSTNSIENFYFTLIVSTVAAVQNKMAHYNRWERIPFLFSKHDECIECIPIGCVLSGFVLNSCMFCVSITINCSRCLFFSYRHLCSNLSNSPSLSLSFSLSLSLFLCRCHCQPSTATTTSSIRIIDVFIQRWLNWINQTLVSSQLNVNVNLYGFKELLCLSQSDSG